jgi:hypothetical protein
VGHHGRDAGLRDLAAMSKQLIWLAFVFVAFAVFFVSEAWRPTAHDAACARERAIVENVDEALKNPPKEGGPGPNLTGIDLDLLRECGIQLPGATTP